jgi:hypothetical protein
MLAVSAPSPRQPTRQSLSRRLLGSDLLFEVLELRAQRPYLRVDVRQAVVVGVLRGERAFGRVDREKANDLVRKALIVLVHLVEIPDAIDALGEALVRHRENCSPRGRPGADKHGQAEWPLVINDRYAVQHVRPPAE